MSSDNPTSGDDFLMKLRSSVQRAADAQLARHAKAGNPISRDRAVTMAIEQHRQKLIRLGGQLESEGSDGSADTFRELADLLPEAMREVGLK